MLVFFEFLTVENTHFVSAMPGNVGTKTHVHVCMRRHASSVRCTDRRALCVKIKNNGLCVGARVRVRVRVSVSCARECIIWFLTRRIRMSSNLFERAHVNRCVRRWHS